MKKLNEFYLISSMILASVLMIIMCINIRNNTDRINEQKRLLIAQQEQINKLILNAKKNELNK